MKCRTLQKPGGSGTARRPFLRGDQIRVLPGPDPVGFNSEGEGKLQEKFESRKEID